MQCLKKLLVFLGVIVCITVLSPAVEVSQRSVECFGRLLRLPSVALDQAFTASGIDSNSQSAIVLSGWDEDVVVDAIVRCKAFRFLDFITPAGVAKLGTNSLAKMKGPLIANRFPELVSWGLAFSESDREEFRPLVRQLLLDAMPDSKVMAEKRAKYWGTGRDALSAWDAQDVLEVILAPEFNLNEVQMGRAKNRIREVAVVSARKKLRSDGHSFVAYRVVTTNDGVVSTSVVNPLVDLVKPVVDAINAPCMIGIEDAFASLGVTVAVRREGLTNLVYAVRDGVLDGSVLGTENTAWLPKLSVVLGVSEYNRFVETYNRGKGTSDH